MDRVVEFNGKKIGLRATALTPRLYRFKIGRDMMSDMNKLKKSFKKAVEAKETENKKELSEEQLAQLEEDAQLDVLDLTIFENVAYIMAKQYDKSLPDSVDEWLDSQDEVFTVYELLPDILDLWRMNNRTTSTPAKK